VAAVENQDETDMNALLDLIENEILPAYADTKKWSTMVLQSMTDVNAYFDSDRMADEYYTKLYI
jgi:glycogen phosphorylase